MKLGYPCINRGIGCTPNSTFRLSSYSEEKMRRAVGNNLSCLSRILEFNLEKGLLFFRIGSQIVPFASHPVCQFDWEGEFREQFSRIGRFVRKNKMRISMHPDQFVLINSQDAGIVQRSVRELEYHCRVLDLMGLDSSAKVQMHMGGVYGDKEEAIRRFVTEYKKLPASVKKRLVIENDGRLFSLQDCLEVHRLTGTPVLFDVFHHKCNNNGESVREAVNLAASTWRKGDGVLMVDYSSQKKGERAGAHADHIDLKDFARFLKEARGIEFDVMLEIKDKEKSALKALEFFRK
ncbi:MAG: UV DNA damage repair endonuclease UvsE [Candidatus Bilamarchaeaceae archaeon]